MIIAIIALSALEIAHITVPGSWNNEIFTSIVGLTGTVLGTLVGVKA
ncbi:hypothetical protein KEJ33_05710 [Candidatus Bathyarchaeota archaeon]|nr:hypothetical protein [Candidatus Bathyarchaeota archaeon]